MIGREKKKNAENLKDTESKEVLVNKNENEEPEEEFHFFHSWINRFDGWMNFSVIGCLNM